ncbi:MAG: Rpn family recombination-promoting nuclease/putative transposase [Lachnospiraceae bacterium]|nr:Rpn family recombination-promoting nuclease/putative transposase [Lachnospiraceae bacterium]
MSEKTIHELLFESPLSEGRKKKLSAIFRGEFLPSITYDVVAKHIFSPDLNPERMDFILQHTMKDTSINVDKSASNEIYLQNVYSKKTITDIPAWLKDHRLADLGIQNAAQEFIFDRADIYASNMLLLQYSAEADQPKSEIDYRNVKGTIIIVLMAESPRVFKDYKSDRYIHRITKARADSGLEFPMLKQMVFVQLDKALELYLSRGYNEDEDVELLKLFALIADVNNETVKREADNNKFLDDILEDVYRFTRSKEVQQMILAEDLAIMDWNSNMNLARREGESEGEARGIEIGEEYILGLFNWLHSQNRDADFQKAASDPAYRTELLEEFEKNK